MIAEILTIGDELIAGFTVNTNAAVIARIAADNGVETRWVTAIGDNETDIIDALNRGVSRADVVITTGGLGPTHDDITKAAVTKCFGSNLVLNEPFFRRVEAHFRMRGWSDKLDTDFAMFPEEAELISNSVGMMPGYRIHRSSCHVFVLPGVPAEMEAIMHEGVAQRLRGMHDQHIVVRQINTCGLFESELHEKLKPAIAAYSDLRFAFLPGIAGVALRIRGSGSRNQADRRLESAIAEVRELAGNAVYGEGDVTLESVVAGLLLERGLTISVAESCTGGFLSHLLTNIPGSSQYFLSGTVTYSNESKTVLLNVDRTIIEKHGAVSEEVAVEMAEHVRDCCGSDIGVSITGIAGPGGGSPGKPVGRVYMGFAMPDRTIQKTYTFFKDRLKNKERFAYTALNNLRQLLQ